MEHTTPAPDGSIVVGIDDSAESRTALLWAADLARSSGRHLEAAHVIGYDAQPTAAWAGTIPSLVYSDDTHAADRNRRNIVAMFDDVQPEPTWDLTFAQGPAAEFLVEHARTAHLLVVGTGEHRGITRALIGSISRYCLGHSVVPVVAVPTPESQPPAAEAPDGLPGSRTPDHLAPTR